MLPASRFLKRVIGLHGLPEKISIDKSGANTAAIQSILADTGAEIELRQIKYLNNIVEQDTCAIKCSMRPMRGLKSFHCASIPIAGIEIMHVIKKGHFTGPAGQVSSTANQFYSRAY